MNCCIDIGNTLIKVGLFEESKLIELKTFLKEKDLLYYLEETKYTKLIVADVRNIHQTLLEKYEPIVFNHSTKIPIYNKYGTPETLGIDRLAAVLGASSMIKGKNVLVIDAGTCITYDFINENLEYLGGGISPGINMKFKALHNFTSKLPLIDEVRQTALVGKTTKESIMSGIINGTISEISGIITRYQNISDNFALVFCGGDSNFLRSQLDYELIYEENLVLIGLNEVLKLNG